MCVCLGEREILSKQNLVPVIAVLSCRARQVHMERRERGEREKYREREWRTGSRGGE
jgi:hypothetical protein